VNAALFNEFLKEGRQVEALETTRARQHLDFSARAARQRRAIEKLAAAVAARATQNQQVNDRLDAARPAPRTVSNRVEFSAAHSLVLVVVNCS